MKKNDRYMDDVLRRAGAAPLINRELPRPEEPHQSAEGNWIDPNDSR